VAPLRRGHDHNEENLYEWQHCFSNLLIFLVRVVICRSGSPVSDCATFSVPGSLSSDIYFPNGNLAEAGVT